MLAMNFIALENVSINLIYDHFTCSRLVYQPGSRPKLERIAIELAANCSNELDIVKTLVDFIATNVSWAGYYKRATGQRLRNDRNLSEEELIDSRFAYCGEQARILCALTQIIGIPSRMVFAENPKHGAYARHVVAEVLLPNGWMMADASLNCCFVLGNRPVGAVDVYGDRDLEALYGDCCAKLKNDLGDIFTENTCFFYTGNPLSVFKKLGFYNYFIL